MYAQAFSMLVDGNKRNTAQPACPLPPPTPPPRPPPPPPAQASTHETCTFPDCAFVGSRKAVSTHYTSTHGMYSGSGIKSIVVEGKSFGVLLGDDPEEIKLWREQRRSRFPTTANTQQKLDTNNNIQLLGGIVGHNNKSTKPNADSKTSSSSSHTRTTTAAVCKTFLRIGKCKYGKRCRYIHDSTPTAGPPNTTDLTNTANSTTDNTANNTTTDNTTNSTEQTSTTTADSTANQSPGIVQKPPHRVRDTHKSNDTPTTGRSEVKRQRISYHTNLLERLLDDEIVYEDNTILQCIRYLCVNKLNKTSS